ncbi:hypothetical protein AVEN_275739-1 [Araneus ventricosus]|uniref:Uncharacterized protein n=1 Tax=Araneus ventricosus TaxID=182803 RepID=A0A4Y2LU99_ARAVE|nr:hypothetical protein AVEN_275739-1 [Araneus ventricosus]
MTKTTPTGMALEFARRGTDLPDRGYGLPNRGHDLLYRRGDECNKIGLKFLPDYYLSTTVEYPVQIFSPDGIQKFSPMGEGTASPTGALATRSPLWRHPWTPKLAPPFPNFHTKPVGGCLTRVRFSVH